MKYTIKNKTLSVTVESYGAEMVSVEYNGKERLWQNATGEWAGHAPLLFPVCGHFGVTVDGVSYPISAHGFAKKSEFAFEKSGENFLTFSLSSNENTKKVYPFDFIFRVTYRVDGGKLTVEYAVENTGDKPLYFACGSHETYALDQNVDGYELRFEKDETFTHLYHDKAGYLTGETKEFGNGKTFALPRDFLQNGETIIFQDLSSRKLALWEKSGEKLADVTFDGFSNLLLWRNGDGKFICIEPWTNLPDPAGAKDSEFSTKAGVMKVEKGQTKTLTRTITYY